jgi:hypothetical protein
MTPQEFAYWLQGFFELSPGTETLSKEQTQVIKNHLNMVFIHSIDPAAGGPEVQQVLNNAHSGIPQPLLPGQGVQMNPSGRAYRC